MPLPENEVTTHSQMKAAAIMNFVDLMIGALDSGFIDKNNPTLSEIHQVARNHVKDNYNQEYASLSERWDEETAKACGLNH